jgi:protein TonB
MNSLIHSLNIGTLATWLSVGSFGTVGILVPAWQDSRLPERNDTTETSWSEPEITLGSGEPADAADAAEADSPESGVPALEVPDEVSELLPLPPELPEISALSPLPELPELPEPPTKRPGPTKQEISAGAGSRASQSTRPPAGTAGRSGSSNRQAAGVTPGGGAGGSGMSNSARLAAGRMPAPVYPSEARRRGQTGTVLVEFTVDGSGKVISAYAKSPSPWPLLNNEAVRTVRRWKFPPGEIMKLQRPIIFQLR